MTNQLETARQFLANVVPWPGEGLDGFVNVHYAVTPPGKDKPIFPGFACQTVAEAASAITKVLSRNQDAYFCTSLQSTFTDKVAKSGHHWKAAKRLKEYAVALRSFFLDIDIGKEGHSKDGYVSIQEAFRALAELIRQTGLPKPTYVVTSGGGIHVYWTLAEAMPADEWKPYAHALVTAGQKAGLVADFGASTDTARILRVPQTFNYKLAQPRPVELGINGQIYSNDRILKCLEPFKGNVPAPVQTIEPSFVGAAQAINARYHGEEKESLGAGVEHNSTPKNLDDIANECPYIKEAIDTGGAAFNQTLWSLSTLISCFTVGGSADAHRMASGHDGYNVDTTQELFERKQEERERGVGWPSCRAISVEYAGCASCPHFSKGKSPLNLASLGIVPVLNQGALLSKVITDLPDGYKRNDDGRVMIRLEETDDDGNIKEFYEHIALRTMEEPYLVRETYPVSETLHFKSRERMGNGNGSGFQDIIIPCSDIGGRNMRSILMGQGFHYYRHSAAKLEDFFVAWMNFLRDTRDMVLPASYGWTDINGTVSGFSYANKQFSPTGEKEVSIKEDDFSILFKPTGVKEPWYEAWKLIAGRPDMEVIVAAAFAAPLMGLIGHNGVTLSVYSDSGAGKSTAIELGLSVWGDPKLGKFKTNDTKNSVMTRIGRLKNLPPYWDEVKTQDQIKEFITLTFDMTLGTDKARLNRNAEVRRRGDWQTILTMCSNDSLLGYIASNSHMNEAGIVRIFEYEAEKLPPGDPRRIDLTTATQVTADLQKNYGNLGIVYAKYLGENYGYLREYLKRVGQKFEAALKSEDDERFWVHLITALFVGAQIAKNLDLVDFDVQTMKRFLFQKFEEQRKNRKDAQSNIKGKDTLQTLISQFLSAHQRNVLWTDDVQIGPGRPHKKFTVLNDPNHLMKLESVKIQLVREKKLMRISVPAMKDWCTATKKASPHAFVKYVMAQYDAKKVMAQLGANTNKEFSFSITKDWVLDIDLTKHPELNVFG